MMTTNMISTSSVDKKYGTNRLNVVQFESGERAMNFATRLVMVVLMSYIVSVQAHASNPREELKQLTAQLQSNPNDIALREKIIKLAARTKPAPAIPEEANRAFVKGNVFQREAKDASGYALAITAYREALRYAPWWGDAYFNLAIAQESAGKFDEAIISIRNYMASVQAGSTEARDAQNKIYALEAKKEIAAKRELEQTNRFSGNWSNWLYSIRIDTKDSSCSVSNAVSRLPDSPDHTIEARCAIENKILQLSVAIFINGRRTAWAVCELRTEADGNKLIGKVLSGGTSADTSAFLKDSLCQELKKQ